MVLRYRRSSLKTMLGITAEKKRLKRRARHYAVEKPFRWWATKNETSNAASATIRPWRVSFVI